MSEAELVQAIAAGDSSAMDALFERFHGPVFRLARASLGDRDAALDIVSEVMIAVWRGAKRFEGRSSVRSWVLGIARHKIHDQHKAWFRWPRAREDEDKPDALVALREDEPRLAGERRALAYCLRKLPLVQRAALHLAFREELTSAQIAEVQGLKSAATARTRIHYAKVALRRCLEQRGVQS